MPSFFFYSKDGDSLFLAQRLLREGHQVRMYIHNAESRNVGNGLVPKSPSPVPHRGDLVIFDMTGFGAKADALKRSGFKVLGDSAFADKLEQDRGYAIQVMIDAGISVPPTQEFTRVDQAREFLKKQSPETAYYIKPSGDEECSATHGAKNVPDMVRWLRYLVASRQMPKKFLLQKKLDSFAELSFEGWFDGKKWVLPWNSTIEDKRFLAGNVGPNTGCMANLVWAYESDMPLLAMRTLTRLTPLLRMAGYVGPIDINVVFGKDGNPFGLEFTPRFGYLALQALSSLIGGDFGTQLWEFSNGTLEKFNVATDRYSLAIGVSVPPYPNAAFAKAARGIPLDPTLLFDPLRVLLTDVMIVDGEPFITGSDAGVAAFVDTGRDIEVLRSTVLDRIKKYAIPKAQYRCDPVKRAELEVSFLQEHAYEVLESYYEVPKIEYEIAEPMPVDQIPSEGMGGDSARSTGMNPAISHSPTQAPNDTYSGPTF